MSDEQLSLDPQVDSAAEIVDETGNVVDSDAAINSAVDDLFKSSPQQMISAVRMHYVAQRAELLSRIEAMEAFLGFVEVEGDLAVRVGKLERFVGVKS